MLDSRDRKLLTLLQKDAEVNMVDLANRLALSPSACSRRIGRLRAEGYITGSTVLLDRRKVNLPTTIFLLVRTGRHSGDWLEQFHAAVSDIPEIVEVHRLTGNFDYIAKIVLPNVEYYDNIYKQIMRRVEMFDMAAHISMETVKDSAGLPMMHV